MNERGQIADVVFCLSLCLSIMSGGMPSEKDEPVDSEPKRVRPKCGDMFNKWRMCSGEWMSWCFSGTVIDMLLERE